VQSTLADDFTGTAPDGIRYTKEQELEETKTKSTSLGIAVWDQHTFLGGNLAVVYGSQSRIQKENAVERRKDSGVDGYLVEAGRTLADRTRPDPHIALVR
jgi:hypothetical protein